MARDFTEVTVKQQLHPKASLLVDGTGTSNDGRLDIFACHNFAVFNRPIQGEKYVISALDKKNIRVEFTGVCTFSGENSEFKRL